MRNEVDRMQNWVTRALAMITEDMGEACACAYEAGRYRLDMPSTLLQHASLKEAYEKGSADAAMEHKRDDGIEDRVSCWSGEWEMDLDGACEARPMVATDAKGYYAGLQVSRMGGDSMPSWSEPPFSSIDQAMKAANALLAEWSQGEVEKEGSFQSAFLQLAFWKWDGKDVREILTKTKSTPIWELFPEKKADWVATVPAEWRGKVRGADTNLSTVNSEDYQINHVEILAMDNLGQALLLKASSNNYTDADWSEVVVISKDDAFAIREECRSSYTSQQALGRFDVADQKPHPMPSGKLRG